MYSIIDSVNGACQSPGGDGHPSVLNLFDCDGWTRQQNREEYLSGFRKKNIITFRQMHAPGFTRRGMILYANRL